MPHIHVNSLPGRSDEEKMMISKALMKTLMETAKVPAEACYVTFGDVERSNWLEYDRTTISADPAKMFIYKGEEKK